MMVAQNDGSSSPSALERTAGIRVSQDWLGACQVHLQQRINDDSNDEDAVLQQVLYSDLRLVVEGRNENNDTTAPSFMLRQAVQQSSISGKATLPENFRLLLQVEEVLDVSVNAETRLSVGPASRTAPSPVGNQHSRCLKLYVSDGFSVSNSSGHLIAMEVPPLIADLSVNSLAGCKILLRGPVDIRLGVIMLHNGNATTLGGKVASLVETQKKALQQAKKVAGVGVDPTVRALIWNPLTGMEEEQDEGEEASGDVVAQAPATFPSPAPGPLPPSSTRTAMPPPPSSRAVMPPPAARVPTAMSSSVPLSRPTTAHRLASSVSAGSQSSRPPLQAPTAAPQQRHLSPPPPHPSHRVQQLAHSSASSSSGGSAHSNPYSNPCSSNQHRGGPQVNTQSTSSQETIDLVTPTNDESNPFADDHVAQLASVPPRREDGTDGLEHLSFAELRSLMERIRTNKELYRQYEGQVFVVTCKMTGSYRFFNILKKKNYKGTDKSDKYEYVNRINLCAPGATHSTITATISNDILLKCFAKPPGEVRAMSKKDRGTTGPGTSADIIAKGGNKATKLFAKPAEWHLELLDTADEFFATDPPIELDGDESMLKIIRKHDGTV